MLSGHAFGQRTKGGVVGVSKRIALCASRIFALLAVGSVALADVINGTSGDDTLVGTSRADDIFGHEGNDTTPGPTPRGSAREHTGVVG